ncbi:MAG: CshA-type fibril repeat protein, partial [Cyclobacteriaceae bacterium]
AGAYVSGTGIWTIGSLSNGGIASLTITATVNASGDYNNTASVDGDQDDPDPSDDTDNEEPAVNPVADDENVTIPENTPVTVSAVTGDFDPDGLIVPSSIILVDPNEPFNTGGNLNPVTISGEGVYEVDVDGNVTFTPEPNYNGVSRINYTVEDNEGHLSNLATITVTVTPVNDPPVADNETVETGEDTPITFDIIDGDVDSDGTMSPSTIILIYPGDSNNTGNSSTPLVISGEGTYTVGPLGNVTFTPEVNYTGTSIINYTVEDNLGAVSNVATITIIVTPANDPPVAIDDQETTDEDTPVTVAVLDNDSDVDGDDLEVTVATSENGTPVINLDGSITFTSNTDFVGEAIVNYTITDGNGGFDEAIVTITIGEDRAISVVVDEVCISNTPYVNYTITPVDFATTELATIIWRKLDGTIVQELINQSLTGQLLWPGAELDDQGIAIAWPGWDFVDGIWIQLNDGLRPEMELVISVNPDNVVMVSYPPATPTCSANPNNPPVAIDDELVTDEDTPVTGDLVENDFDREGDDITIKTTPIAAPTNGTVVINIDGTFTYTPNDMFNGVDSFVYEICDNGLPSMCAQATANITVGPVNDPPIAMDDEGETDFETPVTGDLIGNDEDPDGDNLTVTPTPVTPPSNGTVVLNPDGSYTYTPEDGFVGTDTFVYQVCDDGIPSICDEAKVIITVNSTNQPPVAVDDETITDSITPAEGNVLDNDSDPDGDNLTVNPNPISNPINGTLILNPDGSYVYTPDPQFEGTDSFEYEVCDDGVPSLCTIAEVVITVELPPLDIPQIFGGANNPSWFIEGIEEYPDNHVQVFNRWGNKVFEIKGYDNNSRNWASQSSVGIILGNNQVPDGTYFYVIDLGDGSKPKSGFVVVNR